MDIVKQELYNWLSKSLLMDISPETLFFKDLRLGEEDIETFFHEFIEKYKIDATSFDYKNYSTMKLSLTDVWFKRNKTMSFTGEHLYNVIKAGKWFDPK